MCVVFSEAADLGVSAGTDDRLEAGGGEADGRCDDSNRCCCAF